MKSLCFLVAFIASLVSCKRNAGATLQGIGGNGVSGLNTLALFKNREDFAIEDIKRGKVCGSVRNGKVQWSYRPWPDDMKIFLSRELNRFEYRQGIVPYVGGIYLVDFMPSNVILGLTCHNARTNKYHIFIDSSAVIRPRDNRQVDVASYVADWRSQGIPVLESRGDVAVQTLIHELFHVMDLAIYLDHFAALMSNKQPRDLRAAKIRQAFFRQSWRSLTESLFDNILNADTGNARNSLGLHGTLPTSTAQDSKPMAGLAFDDVVALDHVGMALTRQDAGHRPLSLVNNRALSLANDQSLEEVRALERRLQRLADQTNFVSDYATPNLLEDFAVTLEQYYIGTRYGIWERYEFFAPLPPYVFTPKTLLARDTPQRRKTCGLIRDVLNENCR